MGLREMMLRLRSHPIRHIAILYCGVFKGLYIIQNKSIILCDIELQYYMRNHCVYM